VVTYFDCLDHEKDLQEMIEKETSGDLQKLLVQIIKVL
jgi:hypothetical protein